MQLTLRMEGLINSKFGLWWKVSCSILLLIFTTTATALDLSSLAVPYVQNYTKSQYLFGNQNWCVTSDASGVMYFGNTEGLLSFDGSRWQRYTTSKDQIVRSVAASADGRLYVGLFGDFGYWSYNSSHRFVYTSLTKLLPASVKLTDEVWKIYVEGKRVVFQSFSNIFIYEDGAVKVLNTGNPYLFLLKAGKRLFIQSLEKGLYELQGTSLNLIPGSQVFNNTSVLAVIELNPENVIIGTARQGLFLYDGQKIIPWQTEADPILKSSQLNNGMNVRGGLIAVGTIQNGVLILNRAGKLVHVINKSSGLQNNTVLGMYCDKQQNLWLALDNGIDRIDLHSPFSFYFDKSGELGSVYDGCVFNNKLYLGSNHGLFYTDMNSRSPANDFPRMHLIPGTQGQVWDLSIHNGQLLCGHNDGTFLIRGDRAIKISSNTGGWTMCSIRNQPDVLIQGVYNGLVVYRSNGLAGTYTSEKVAGFGQASRYVEQDEIGNIWVSHPSRGLYKLQLSTDLRRVMHSSYYNHSHGLPAGDKINVFNVENKVIFSTDKGLYTYDDLNDRFILYQQLNNKLGSFSYAERIQKANGRNYWFYSKGQTALVSFEEQGRVSVDSTSFYRLNGRQIRMYQEITSISPSQYLACLEDGYAFYSNRTTTYDLKKTEIPEVLIRGVDDITNNETVLLETIPAAEFEIPYSGNNIRIYYSLPYYEDSTIEYKYFLEGYSSQWSDLSELTSKDFTNLSSGHYTFKVKALVNRKFWTPESAFHFRVLPPWYLTGWAIVFVILIHLLVFYFLWRLYMRKLDKHRRMISLKMMREKEEQLIVERKEQESIQVKLRNEQLQADLEGKGRELTNMAMNIVYKNELLKKLKDELANIKDSTGHKLGNDQLNRLYKVIEEAGNDERDWNLFELSFNETHENFFKKLKADYTDLVPNDLKLCAYLRMNMNSKEIAGLLNITLRGVEIRRYRLRKKLNLDQQKNLTEFLMEI